MKVKTTLKGISSLLLLSLMTSPLITSSAHANPVENGYFQVNDALKSNAFYHATSNSYGVSGTGVGLPYANNFDPNVPSHTVTMDISAYTDLVNGTGYNCTLTMKYLTYATNILVSTNASVTVTPVEKRLRISGTIPNNATSVALYYDGVSVNGTTVLPLRVRDFRARYTNFSTVYTRYSPINLNYTAPLDGQTLTAWPAITNGTNIGSGISGTTAFYDGRANTIDHVWVSIQRYSDNKWWNGTSWQAGYIKLAAARTNSAWSYNQVPTGANLTDGTYRIITSAHDEADPNTHYATEKNIDVTFSSAPPPTPTPTPTQPPTPTPTPPPTLDAADLDTTFDIDGKVLAAFGVPGSRAICHDVLIQPDGKIITAGSFGGNWAIGRHTTAGALDTSFNNDGKVTTNYGGDDSAQALALQSDGKIIAVGSGQSGAFVGVTRYLSNGTHDTSFSGDGKVGLDFGLTSISGRDVAVQSDGKILVVGSATGSDGGDFTLARLNSDGSLDTTFSGDGIATLDFGGTEFSTCLALQSDGKILVAGTQTSHSGFMLMARFNSNGSLDTTFSGNGLTDVDFGAGESAQAMAVQSDGKIVLAGSFFNGANNDFALARFNSDGSLDNTFSGDGKVTTALQGNDVGMDVAVQSDGRIVQVGTTQGVGASDFGVVRFNSNGTYDTTFSGDGITTTDFSGGSTDEAEGVAIQSNGRIVVAGSSGENFAIARYRGTATAFDVEPQEATTSSGSPSFNMS